MIVLTSAEIEKCKQFAIEVTATTLNVYQQRNSKLTETQAIENAFRGKAGELAVYKYLLEHDYYPSEIDFTVTDKKHHGADIEIIGKGILLHIKTCKKSFLSWLFEKRAKYVSDPKANDFICLVKQESFDCYEIISIRHSSGYDFLSPILPMRSKLAIYL